MPYLGRPVTNAGQFEIIDDISSGFDGSETSFTLQVGGTDIQPDAANVTIVLDGVVQIPSSAYAVTASTLNFSEAPTSGTEFHGVLAGQSQFIESGFITNTHISDSANISGSKINTDFSAQTVKAAIFDGMVSGSAQLADDISGSFSQTHLSSKISGIISGAAQLPSGVVSASVLSSPAQGTIGLATNGVNNNVDSGLQVGDSPTFAGGTITGDFSVGGTLTAQEIHTEFESASILFTSGSTQFGNSSDDVHEMTGSLNVSGGINLNNGNLNVTDMAIVSTRIGIGGSPSYRLDVQDTADPAQIRLKQSGNTNGLFLKNYNGNEAQIDNLDNGPLVFKTNDNEVVRFTATGTVGIGTHTPRDGKLHIHNGSSGAVSYVQLTQDGTGAASGDGLLVGVNAAEASIIYNAEDTPLIFYTDKNERVRIDNNGKVGIGTNNPRYPLVVSGSGQNSYIHFPKDNDSTSDGLVVGYATESDGVGNAYFYNYENSKLIFGTNNAVKMSVNSDGVTIGGTAAAQRALHVQSSTGICLSDGDRDRAALIPVSPSAPNGGLAINIRSGSASHERIRVDYEGRVGINTNNPDFRFHIYNASDSEVFWGQDAGGVFQCVGSNQHMRFLYDNGSSEAMRIKDGGFIGIGTNNPSTVLHNYIANGTYSNESTSHFINQAGSNRATIRNRSNTDNPSEIFFDINGAIRWCYSARETSDNTIRLFPQASSPSLTSVAGSVFTLTQGGNLTIGGSYSPFTGTHLTVPASGSSKLSSVQHWSSSLDDYVGKIVVSSGTFIDNKYQSGSIAKTIDEAWPQIELANAYKDKKVLGVVSGIEGNPFIENTPQNESELRQNEHRFIGVNSLGEGCIWISNLSGSLENGDYITSSPIEGYGMKQDDDLLHNYTVAKISEDCDFSGNGHVTSSITHNGVTYKTAFVGCTYHCG